MTDPITTSSLPAAACPLCDGPGGTLLATGNSLRVIRAEEAGFPAFYRVVWQLHVAEFSDLSPEERQECMEAVACVERALREHMPAELVPDKVNLAALGNMVPHLHWHVIARYRWDTHFPSPVWASPSRPASAAHHAALIAALPQVESKMIEALEAAGLAHRPVTASATSSGASPSTEF